VGQPEFLGHASLTSRFHNEVTGGERFFTILEQMQQDPGRHAEVIELMYLCTSLGFEGRYRVLGRGTGSADRTAGDSIAASVCAPGRIRTGALAAVARHSDRQQAIECGFRLIVNINSSRS
jgi:type IV/VI secretion system ImpK/VasF family protein